MFCSTSSKNAEHEWNCTEENATMTIARHHASNLKILGGRIGQVSLGPILKLLKFIRL